MVYFAAPGPAAQMIHIRQGRADLSDKRFSFMHRYGRQMRKSLAAIALAALVLAGCETLPEDEFNPTAVEVLYNSGLDQMLAGNYRTAGKLFDEVERQHPYSVWATKAELMSAYAKYQDSEYDDAIIALNRYVRLHPGSRDIAYAYYLRALAHYQKISDVKREQSAAEQALKAFDELVKRYPNTKYTRDARDKMDVTRDHLAGSEMDRGRFYLKRNLHLAAINRFRYVVDNYQTTTQVPEALHRLVESYVALGLKEEARQTAAVLGYNYPSSVWYMDTYALVEGVDVRPPEAREKEGFFSRIWSNIF